MSARHSDRVDREPCPWRIVDDAGGAFLFGLGGGTIWHFCGGVRNAPSGQRLTQAVSRVRARVPLLGGSFAVWGTIFSSCDCTLTYFRQKEDPWNAILSGAATGGILAARAGLKAAGRSALVGGVILAAIEGLGIVMSRVISPSLEQQEMQAGKPVDTLLPPPDPLRPRMPKRQSLLGNSNGSNSNNSGLGAPSPLLGGGLGGDFFSTPASSTESSSTGNWDAPGFRSEKPQEQPKSEGWSFWK